MYKIFKNISDKIVVIVTLPGWAPIMLIIAMIIYFKIGSPVFYLQSRAGKNGKKFMIYKFRSMSNKKDTDGNLLPDHLRLSAFGKKLRSTSLDELPSLLNVLKGEMSLVGPRPLLTEYLPLYSDFQQRRHELKPGITGWAQINGRNALSWEEKFKLDVWYVDNLSFVLDVKILFKTIIKVFKSEGVSPSESVTMEVFKGTK